MRKATQFEEKELNFIRKHLNNDMSASEIAKRFERSTNSILIAASKMRKLGVNIPKFWRSASFNLVIKKWRKKKPQYFIGGTSNDEKSNQVKR